MRPEDKFCAVARELGLPTPSPASGDRCGLRLDGHMHMELWLAPATGSLWITADLGTAAAGPKAGLYRFLLGANLVLPEGRNDHFALEPPGQVSLCRTLDLATHDVDHMAAQVLELGDLAQQWQQLLSHDGLIGPH